MGKYREKAKSYLDIKKRLYLMAMDTLYDGSAYLSHTSERKRAHSLNADQSLKKKQKQSLQMRKIMKKMTQKQIKGLVFHNDNWREK